MRAIDTEALEEWVRRTSVSMDEAAQNLIAAFTDRAPKIEIDPRMRSMSRHPSSRTMGFPPHPPPVPHERRRVGEKNKPVKPLPKNPDLPLPKKNDG